MKKPNFFVLGAPKCGTTSLCTWLSAHTEIFFSPVKEPNFFNSESAHTDITSLAQYEACFARATAQHKAVGEGSVWYLKSGNAVANILRYAPQARFIVCIRNPVVAARSLHQQAVYSGEEPITDFEDAWQAQSLRKSGAMPAPRTCLDINHLMYGETYLYGEQIQRLYEQVDRSRVVVVTLDDMKRDPASTYRRVLQHLDVADDCRTRFIPQNPAKDRRWRSLAVVLQYLAVQKTRLGIRSGTGLGALLSRLNSRERKRDPADPGVDAMLRDYFRDDIALCGSLIDADLSAWTRPA